MSEGRDINKLRLFERSEQRRALLVNRGGEWCEDLPRRPVIEAVV